MLICRQPDADERIGDWVNGYAPDDRCDGMNEPVGDQLNGIPEEQLYENMDNMTGEARFWMKRFSEVLKDKNDLMQVLKFIADQKDISASSLSEIARNAWRISGGEV